MPIVTSMLQYITTNTLLSSQRYIVPLTTASSQIHYITNVTTISESNMNNAQLQQQQFKRIQ